MLFSPELAELAKAFAAAQGEIRPAVKDASNPHFRSTYADLASVWDACRDVLSKHGLSIVQGCHTEGKVVTVETMLLHASGQWVSDSLSMEAANGGPQAVGSAITYGRRYGLAALVGIAPEDDDGEGAEGRGKDRGEKTRAEVEKPRGEAPASSGGGTWTGTDAKGRTFRSTGKELPRGWFQRVKEDRSAAVEEIGGTSYCAVKNPDTGKWEVGLYIDTNDQVPY